MVHLEMALWVYTVWNHGVSRICGFLSFVKFETLLAIFPRYHFFLFTHFLLFLRLQGQTLETLVPSSPWDLSPSFPLSYLHWTIFIGLFISIFWFQNSHLDLLYHFYFPIEIVHLSTYFKIIFLLGILY